MNDELSRVAQSAARGRALVWALVFLALVLGAGVLGYYGLQRAFLAPGPSQAPIRVQVDQGASVRR